MTDTPSNSPVGLVVIGRNEGVRLQRCLASVQGVPHRVYVDSGSTDGSVAYARGRGVTVVELAVPPKFTAARARNAGLERLLVDYADMEFVQMVDGDCEVHPEWIDSAVGALRAEPDLAGVYGRNRERFPGRSIYNALCDDEWNTPVGDSAGCGGIAMFRVAALRQVNFYNPAMIAGEDSELSMRLRKKGWRLRRVGNEMTLHDAAITRFSQWWARTRRSGHAYGEMAYLHPDARDPNWPHMVRSIIAWVGVYPVLLVATVVLGFSQGNYGWVAGIILLAGWLVRMLQLAYRQRQRGLSPRVARASAFFLMFGKFPQFLGLIGFYKNMWLGRESRLIEHKRPGVHEY